MYISSDLTLPGLPDVLERWKQLTLVIESPGKEISDTFDISVKIPRKDILKKDNG